MLAIQLIENKIYLRKQLGMSTVSVRFKKINSNGKNHELFNNIVHYYCFNRKACGKYIFDFILTNNTMYVIYFRVNNVIKLALYFDKSFFAKYQLYYHQHLADNFVSAWPSIK